ncbi:MAG: YtxH domain-containing protein [Sulfuricurvum sp.]|nr:YtxH domain-containing protein [Sulfuricurvum sp.]
MERNNAIGLILGAVIGGTVAYYAYKHQDELLSSIHDLEESLNLDSNELIEKTKAQFNQLSQNVQTAIQSYTDTPTGKPTTQEERIDSLMEELTRLRAEIQTLKS